MTLSSAYIELFIRGEKSGGKCLDTAAIDQWRRHLSACVHVSRAHFEHKFYQ